MAKAMVSLVDSSMVERKIPAAPSAAAAEAIPDAPPRTVAEAALLPAATEAPAPRPIGTEVGKPAPLLMALTVRIPPDLGERLRAFSFVTRRGKADLITEALTRFLDEVGG